jgi:hypothetical protein
MGIKRNSYQFFLRKVMGGDMNKRGSEFSFLVAVLLGILVFAGASAASALPIKQLQDGLTYVIYTDDFEFDIRSAKVVSIANDSFLNSAVDPYYYFLSIDITSVWADGNNITFVYDGVNSPVTVQNATGLDSARVPYYEFLSRDVWVYTDGSNISIGHFLDDLDGNLATEISGLPRDSGDDVKLEDLEDDADEHWLVTELSNLRTLSLPSGQSEIELSDNWPNWSTDPTDATENYGIWFDADGDGDIESADDWPIYNDIFIVDRSRTNVTIVPALRIGNLDSLLHEVIEIKGTEYWVKDFDCLDIDVTLVPVDEETLIGAQHQDMLDAALLIPGTDIKVGMLNLSGSDPAPSAEFAIIEGENVIKFEDRDQTTDPVFEIGTDLELLDDFYLVPKEIDVNKSFIKLAIGKKINEFKIGDGDKNVLGYLWAVVCENDDGITDEFRLEDYVLTKPRGEYRVLSGVNNPPSITALTPSADEPQSFDTSITWTCNADDETLETLLYRFYLKGPGTGGVWELVQNFDASNQWTGETTSSDVGNSRVRCWVKDNLGQTDKETYLGYEIQASANNPPTITSLTPVPGEPQPSGTSITWTCNADDESPETLLYRFYLRGPGTGGVWQKMRGYDSTNTWTWTPDFVDIGDNDIACQVKDSIGQKAWKPFYNYKVTAGDYTFREDFTTLSGWNYYDVPVVSSCCIGPVHRDIVADSETSDNSSLKIHIDYSIDMFASTYRKITFPSPVESVDIEYRLKESHPGGNCGVQQRGGVGIFSRDVNPAVDLYLGWPHQLSGASGPSDGDVLPEYQHGIYRPYEIVSGNVQLINPSSEITLVLFNMDDSNICTYDGWWDYVEVVGHPVT